MQEVLLASTDPALRLRTHDPLAAAGLRVTTASTNLELCFRLANDKERAPDVIVLDARSSAFGIDPLRWLRDDTRCAGSLVVLADLHDAAVLAEAELAGAAAVVSGRLRPNKIVREVLRVLHGRRPRELLRWTAPRRPAQLSHHRSAA